MELYLNDVRQKNTVPAQIVHYRCLLVRGKSADVRISGYSGLSVEVIDVIEAGPSNKAVLVQCPVRPGVVAGGGCGGQLGNVCMSLFSAIVCPQDVLQECFTGGQRSSCVEGSQRSSRRSRPSTDNTRTSCEFSSKETWKCLINVNYPTFNTCTVVSLSPSSSSCFIS